MKTVTHSLYRRCWLLLLLAIAAVVASCFKLENVFQEHEAATNGTFTGRITVIGDGADFGGPISHYGLFGICLPEGWSVQGNLTMRQYAPDGTLLSGNDANLERQLVVNEAYSQMLNFSYPAKGYVWVGYQTTTPFDSRLNKQASETNAADSISVVYTIGTDGKEGNFCLEYVVGETEKLEDIRTEPWDANTSDDKQTYSATFESLPTESSVKDDGTENPSIHYPVEANTKVTVTAPTGIKEVTTQWQPFQLSAAGNGNVVVKGSGLSASARAAVYDGAGRLLTSGPIRNPGTTLHAGKGVRVIVISDGKQAYTRKMFIR